MTIRQSQANFSRPADTTPYAAADLVADNTTAGSVTPLKFGIGAGGFAIRAAHLEKSDTGITNADFKMHFYTEEPTVANGDNGAFSSDHAGYVGTIDLPAMTAYSDVAAAVMQGQGVFGYAKTQGGLWALIEVDAAYTPVSGETFTATVTVEKIDQT